MRFGRKRVFVPMSKNPKKAYRRFSPLRGFARAQKKQLIFWVFGFWQDLQDCQD